MLECGRHGEFYGASCPTCGDAGHAPKPAAWGEADADPLADIEELARAIREDAPEPAFIVVGRAAVVAFGGEDPGPAGHCPECSTPATYLASHGKLSRFCPVCQAEIEIEEK